jgi:hypothetical protein
MANYNPMGDPTPGPNAYAPSPASSAAATAWNPVSAPSPNAGVSASPNAPLSAMPSSGGFGLAGSVVNSQPSGGGGVSVPNNPVPVQNTQQPQQGLNTDILLKQFQQQQLDFQKSQAALQKQITDQAAAQQKATEQQNRAAEQQNIALRDIANQFNVPIDFKDGQLMLNGKAVDPTQYGLENVDGRFVGTPDQVASAFGLSQVRGAFEQSGAKVDYGDGLISVNGVNFDPVAEGAVNIGGRFYATPDIINSMHQRAGGTEFNPQTQQGQQVDPVQEQEQKTAIEQKAEQYDKDIQTLNDTYEKVFRDPPKSSADKIQTIMESLKAFKGTYTTEVGSLIQQTLASTFNYDPTQDKMLQDAAQYANNAIMEQMNSRGILNSSITGDKFQQMYKELMPQYYNLAYQRYNDNLNNQFKKIEVLNQMNEQDYNRYYQFASASINQIENIDTKAYTSFKDNLDFIDKQLTRKEKEKSDTLMLEEKKIANAYDRLNTLGYADNKTALTLELPVGTPSGTAKAKAEQRLFDLQKEANSVIAENKKAALVRQQKLEDLQATKDTKKAEDDRKAKAGTVLASLSGMSGEAAMEEVRKNMSLLSDALGENFPDVVKNIQSRIDKDTSEAMADKRLNLSIASAERVANKTNKKDDLNQDFGDDYKELQSMDPNVAAKILKDNSEMFIGRYGPDGYRDLWNQSLAPSIEKNKIKAMKKIPSSGSSLLSGIDLSQLK